MPSPTFEAAIKAFEEEKARIEIFFQDIENHRQANHRGPNNECPKPGFSIRKGRQLYDFAIEQSRYFQIYVKNRPDSIQYVDSVTNVLKISELISQVKALSGSWFFDESELINIAAQAPGSPSPIKGGAKIALLSLIVLSFIGLGIWGVFLDNPIFSAAFMFSGVYCLLVPMLFRPMAHFFIKDFYPQKGSLAEQIKNLINESPDNKNNNSSYITHTSADQEELAEEFSYPSLFEKAKNNNNAGVVAEKQVEATRIPINN